MYEALKGKCDFNYPIGVFEASKRYESLYKNPDEMTKKRHFIGIFMIPDLYLSDQASNEFLHGRFGLASFLVELVLSLGAHEVVLGILGLVISIAVDVVCQETDSLHVWEQLSSIRQHLDFQWSEEYLCRFNVTLGKCLEDFHVELNVVQVGIVFLTGIGCRTEEVTEVRESLRTA